MLEYELLLKYQKTPISACKCNGLQAIPELEPAYSYVENRTIYKVDIFSVLTKYFSKEIYDSIRLHIFRMVGKFYSEDTILKVFRTIYENDSVFKEYVISTLDDYDGDEENILFDILFNPMVSLYTDTLNKFTESLKGTGVFFIADSFGYAYVSVKQECDYTCSFPTSEIGA